MGTKVFLRRKLEASTKTPLYSSILILSNLDGLKTLRAFGLQSRRLLDATKYSKLSFHLYQNTLILALES